MKKQILTNQKENRRNYANSTRYNDYCVANFSGNQYCDTNGRKWNLNKDKYSKRHNKL